MKEFRFNVVKEERKALVRAIGDIIGIEPKYMGAPGFVFVIGDYRVSANGTVTVEGEYDSNALGILLAELAGQGFSYEAAQEEDSFQKLDFPDSINDNTNHMTHFTDNVDVEGKERLSIDIPMAYLNASVIINLKKLITAKGWILKKMVGADFLPIVHLSDQLIRFPWFKPDASPDEVEAYAHLISQMCTTAKEKRRVMAEEKPLKPGDNEKYKARCFLLSLGFKGSEYSQARKILLSPFSGNGSFLQGNCKKKLLF